MTTQNETPNGTTWTFYHGSGTTMSSEPTDSRGIMLRRQCGYRYVDIGDGHGQRVISMVEAQAFENEIKAIDEEFSHA